MAKCNACGKRSLFLRVNSYGRCKTCEEKYEAIEQDYLERQETEKLFPALLHSYVVTDIETSGLNYSFNAIIEISAIKVLNGEVIEKYTSLVHNERTLSPQIVTLTGITTDMIRKCPKSLETVITEYREFIGKYPLVGHNIDAFDIKFIDKAYMDIYGSHIENKCADTLKLARKYIKNTRDFKLQTLATAFNINVTGSHRALDDCLTTYELYKKISEVAKERQEEKERVLNLDSVDGKIIQMTKEIFKNKEHSYFRYRKMKQYLRGECVDKLFQIKTTGKIKNYIVFERRFEEEILDEISLKTAPASSSERGTTRIFFENEEEFMLLAKYIVGVYELQKSKEDENIERERNFNNSGFIRIENYTPHYEKWVRDYLEDSELIEI